MSSRERDLVHEYLEARLNQRVGRRGFLRLSSGIVVSTAAAGFLAACGAGSSTSAKPTAAASAAPSSAASAAPTAAPTAAASAAPSIAGATIDFIGLDGEDDAKGEKAIAWRKAAGIGLTSKYIGSGDEISTAIRAGQSYDIAMSFNPFVHRFAQGGIIQALDTGRLTNWNDMFEGLRKADFLNLDGKAWGAPIAWGDAPYIYNPKKVKPEEKPKAVMDVLDAKWKKRITMSNDPALLFYGVGLALGFPAPNFTKDQLKTVADQCAPFVKQNVVSFAATYADATDLLLRGEADLSLLGWEAMLNQAKDKGGELAFDLFKEYKGGWSDSMSLPTTAQDVDAAYAYIDACISPEINAEMAVLLVSGAVNSKSEALIPKASNLYNYDVVRTVQSGVFEDVLPPEKPTDPNIASHQDWLDAWAKITA